MQGNKRNKVIMTELESVCSMHTNHSALTTAFHTNVVTDRHGNRQRTLNTVHIYQVVMMCMQQNDVNNHGRGHGQKYFYFGTHESSHNMQLHNNYNNRITCPQLQTYGNQYIVINMCFHQLIMQ